MYRMALAVSLCWAWAGCTNSEPSTGNQASASAPAPDKRTLGDRSPTAQPDVPANDQVEPETPADDRAKRHPPTDDRAKPDLPDPCDGLQLQTNALTRVAPIELHLPDGGFLLTLELHNRTDQVAEMPSYRKVAVLTTAGEQRKIDHVPSIESWWRSFDIEPGAFRRVAILLPGQFDAGVGSVRVREIDVGDVDCVLRRDGLNIQVTNAP